LPFKKIKNKNKKNKIPWVHTPMKCAVHAYAVLGNVNVKDTENIKLHSLFRHAQMLKLSNLANILH
jgi:hypothetical protein